MRTRFLASSTARTALLAALSLVLLASAPPDSSAKKRSSRRAPGSTLSRDADPVVITGCRLPATLLGKRTSEIYAARYDPTTDAFVNIPFQVDERQCVDVSKPYGWPSDTNVKILAYSDPDTLTGEDTDSLDEYGATLLDDNDELVFMAKDAGPRAVSGHPGTSVEVKITDPLELGATGYVYIYNLAGPGPTKGTGSYVDYNFHLLAGAYPTCNGTHPEDTTVSTAYYQLHFSDRWIIDGMKIGNGSGVYGNNLIERFKFRFAPGNCIRTERTFSGYEVMPGVLAAGCFVTNKNGPVRAIRVYLGANSGPLTQREHLFYERRHDITTTVRVHPIPGALDYFDYSASASGMVYFVKDRNSTSVQTDVIDGVPPAVPIAPVDVEWEMVTSSDHRGSVVIATELITDMPPGSLDRKSYYHDQTGTALALCAAEDADEYGASGAWTKPATAGGQIPCTDPLRQGVIGANCPTAYSLMTKRCMTFSSSLGNALTPAEAQVARNRTRNPLAVLLPDCQAPSCPSLPAVPPNPDPCP
jgi:hypothetical protein